MLTKIQKARIMAETLESVISDFGWRMQSAQENRKSYAQKKVDSDYNWEEYDEKELEERTFRCQCYDAIIQHLEKLV